MNVDKDDLAFIANTLVSNFEYYQDKKIFITGGTGFFGKWILETFKYLNEKHFLNVSITILTRSPEKFIEKYSYLIEDEGFLLLQGDILTFNASNESYDLIIHAATDVTTDLNRTNPKLMRDTIVKGVKNISLFANKVGCKRIIYTSSGAAYGPQPELIQHMPESFIDNPLFDYHDTYASAKLESEKYLIKYANCDVVIARCFTFAGPYLPLKSSYAFGNFINDFLNGRDVVIKGDGKSIRSYLYAADLIVWLLTILSSGRDREIYNVGSSKSISIVELAEKISGKEVQVQGESDGNKSLFLPSTEKAKIELGLKENFTLEDIIIKTKKFYGY